MSEDGKNPKSRCIEIVLATESDEDRRVLAEMLAGSIWKLIEAKTLERAAAALRRAKIPILVCDPHLLEPPPGTKLRCLLGARGRANVVLLKDRSGDTPVASSVEFDFITHPLDRHEVVGALFFAYGRCRARECERRARRAVAANAIRATTQSGRDKLPTCSDVLRVRSGAD